MSTEQIPNATSTSVPFVPPPSVRSEELLRNGDQMSRDEFHVLYEQTPEDFKAELIGGIVYVASPVNPAHGKPDRLLGSVLVAYEENTQGVDGSQNTTVLLSNKDEPQPDQYLRILPEYGGQSSTDKDGYVKGAPEFVAEIAYSSRAIDLHAKKRRYTRCGVREYLVGCVREKQLRWFDLAAGKELQPDAAGIYRIQVFPGLWINGPALFAHDYQNLMQTLEEGLATPEHAAFVRELPARRSKS
jgi:Uma2 family endonuclease